jgi:bifunctional non-homologous end joining protein LigD
MATIKDVTELHGVRLTSPEKVLYPEQGVTKRELAEYYVAVADVMLPHVARRPITLVRCPTGRQKKCFYQRHAGSGVPKELKEVTIEGFAEPYLYLQDIRGLIAIVQMGVLELHPWNSHVDKPHKPDQVIFDLDPGEGLAFSDVVAAAHELREHLAGMGLKSVPKTTGGKGLHLLVPIERRYEWRDVKSFAKAVGDALAKNAPNRYLTRQSIAERRGRIYIDYLRNDPTSTGGRALLDALPRGRARVGPADLGRGRADPRPAGLHGPHRAGARRCPESRSLGGGRGAEAATADRHVIRIARKSLTLVSVGPVTTPSPKAAKKPWPSLRARLSRNPDSLSSARATESGPR